MSDNWLIHVLPCLMAAFLLAGCEGAQLCQRCNGDDQPCQTSPVLAASAGDGSVTLTWEPAAAQGIVAKAWQYRQAVQGESWSAARNAGPAATTYVVSDLTNDIAHTFQVRAQLNTDFSCWSDAVSVVPRRMNDVMDRIEKHQGAIAANLAHVVQRMATSQEILRELGEQATTTLEGVATSTSAIAEHSAGIRDGVRQVVTSVDTAGSDIVAATTAVRQQAEGIRNNLDTLASSVDAAGEGIVAATVAVKDEAAGIRNNLDTLASSVDAAGEGIVAATVAVKDEAAGIRTEVGQVARRVDAAGQQVAERLADLAERCQQCADPLESCVPKLLGEVCFANNSALIRNQEEVECIASNLQSVGRLGRGGLVLTVGYATAVGTAIYNLGLTDDRAATVSNELGKSLDPEDAHLFEFRPIARGEAFDGTDLAGKSPMSRRVDVIFCERPPNEGQPPGALAKVTAEFTACGCQDEPGDLEPLKKDD